MIRILSWLLLLHVALLFQASADVQVDFEQASSGSDFTFSRLSPPAINDTGAKANWRLVEGTSDPNGAALAALHDGNVPTSDDDPLANFFFSSGSNGGKILAALRKPVSIQRISSYSWHTSTRGPQVYTVYGTNRKSENNQVTGWKKIADVDTRPEANADPGGRYAVSISNPASNLGEFRYLLFDVRPTQTEDRFGLTFFSEIDIISDEDADLKLVPKGTPLKLVTFQSDDKKYSFKIDATTAPDLHQWSEAELAPVIQEWYPKLVEMLPGEDYTAPTKVSLRYREDMPPGIPASATLFRINLNAPWFRKQLHGEAKGCVVHELVHIVQGYGRTKTVQKKPPSWVVEGIADYMRWFIYEPETGGANLSPERLAQAKHDASYRITANFIDWVARTHDEEIVIKLNDAARKGIYSDDFWKEVTGESVEALADAWRAGG